MQGVMSEESSRKIDGWNWGAFLLGPVWGIGNRVWISLLCFIPFFGIVMVFVLGAKGSRWAWEKGVVKTAVSFLAIQRQWALVGIWLMGIALALMGATVLLAFFLPGRLA